MGNRMRPVPVYKKYVSKSGKEGCVRDRPRRGISEGNRRKAAALSPEITHEGCPARFQSKSFSLKNLRRG